MNDEQAAETPPLTRREVLEIIAEANRDIAIPSVVDEVAGEHLAEIEAKVRADERARIARIVRAKADRMQLPGSKRAALQLAEMIGELGP